MYCVKKKEKRRNEKQICFHQFHFPYYFISAANFAIDCFTCIAKTFAYLSWLVSSMYCKTASKFHHFDQFMLPHFWRIVNAANCVNVRFKRANNKREDS